ncbi:MAG: zinc metallopeptidase [Chloroflexi bacterium]|nr:MAG: zinc metallopeptidase [Chloroflexota bacterium]
MFFDPLYLILTMPALLLALYAQWKVRSAYTKYSQVPNERGISGYQAAQELLSANGLYGIDIEGVPGDLSDHYDPRGKVLRLSQGVANGRSIASLAIVAHEVGHAVQDKQGYAMLRFRSSLVPAANLGSTLGIWLAFGGIIFGWSGLAWLGIALFSAAVVFTLVTLPVELNASSRALEMLKRTNLLSQHDLKGAKSVLSAAALTYVAALAQAVLQLVYLVLVVSGGRRRS